MKTPSTLKTSKVKFGLIGNGQFGGLLIKLLLQFTNGTIVVVSRRVLQVSDKRVTAGSYSDLAQCQYIFPCVPISKLEEVLIELKPSLTSQNIIIDVSSLKLYPKKVLSTILPDTQVVLTHPMFGPGTVAQKNGVIDGLRMTMENLSCNVEDYKELTHFFKDVLKLDVIEMNADEHDKSAAHFHFISQYTSQMLRLLNIEKGEIDTESYRQLLLFIHMVKTDKRLILEMLEFNPYCKKVHENIMAIQTSLNEELKKI